MFKICATTPNIPFKLRKQVRQTKKELEKAGHSNLCIRTNKNGDIAILGYKTPNHDELVISSLIKPDGRQTITNYITYPPQEPQNLTTKVIEIWNKIGKEYTFNSRTTMQFKNSKMPEVISTMYSDANSDDGVKIVTRFPRKEFIEKYQSNK